MSKVKAGGSTKNNKNSPGQRLGVKRFGGHAVREGEILVRQVGQNKVPGEGTFMGNDFTIHAAKDGVVVFKPRRIKKFTGKTTLRTEISVI